MRFLLLTAVFGMMFTSICSFAQTTTDNPVADPAATVVAGKARFTVLTPKLIRMEWSENGQFEDRASFGVVNRNLPVPDYKVVKTPSKVTIKTSDVTLVYTGQEKFNEKNLGVTLWMTDYTGKKPVKKAVTWHPGMSEEGNLLGTTRTLDGFEKDKVREPYDKGPVSRDGWAIIDETGRYLIEEDNSDWKAWVAPRIEGDHQDLYIFAYGHDYKEAVADYIKIGGQIPLPPKYVFGYWWSRYWQYSDTEFLDIAQHMRDMNIPIDIMVIDMDWHYTWGLRKGDSPKDEFDQRMGWTGYTWQKQLFPNPANFLADAHAMKLKTSCNLHPASGIQPYEECYETFRKDYLSRTSDYDGPKDYIYPEGGYTFAGNTEPSGKAGENAPVPFRIEQKDWANAYFNSVIRPLEEMGVDFWWLDWQQWKESKYTPGLSNTFWLNHTFFNDKVRRSVGEGLHANRPLIYHRWGGIGSHRYQIGFSGDTYANWDVLGYLPYFTSTSSNVGYGYWGHDIGGHMIRGKYPTDAQLYTRWLQYGVFTPIYKTHSTKNRWIERRFWAFADYLDPMRAAVRLRYDLSPYIYNAAYQTTATGISMCRPLYYEYPEDEKAYSIKSEFFFGDDILATVIDQPVDSVSAMAERTMWFPEGNDWYDMATGHLYKGGSEKTLYYTIDENPYFVKAGAVIPMADPQIQNLQDASNKLRLVVAPGDSHFETSLYEDDGETQAYVSEHAVTKIVKDSDASKFSMKIAGREGKYEGMLPTREITVILEGVYAPESVKVNGKDYEYCRFVKKGTWSYDGKIIGAVIRLPEMPADQAIEIECTYDPSKDTDVIRGKKGLIGRMSRQSLDMKYAFSDYIDAYLMLPEAYMKIAQGSSIILENPAGTEEFLKNLDPEAFLKELEGYGLLPESYIARLREQSKL